jgi:hypothetical protein
MDITKRQIRFPIRNFAAEASFKRLVHYAVIPADHAFEDILKPGYWASISDMALVRPGSIIEVHRNGGSPREILSVTLEVWKVEPGMVHVLYLGGHVIPETEERIVRQRDEAIAAKQVVSEVEVPTELRADYKIGLLPNKGWYVLFRQNNKYVAQGLPSQQAAIDEAVKHFKTAQTVGA